MLQAQPPKRPFLGVETSFTGRRWRDRLDAAMSVQALAIAQRIGLPELQARILAGRGVDALDAEAFLDASLKRWMPDPDTLTDMEAAIDVLAAAIRTGRRIAIFGDYDVDGATSVALLAGWLAQIGIEAAIHIPDRIFEGYGPNTEAIDRLRADGAQVLVTVDCGTTSVDVLAHARTAGLDVVVIDHHQAGEELPAVNALVNPNRLDDLSGQGHLAACGVTFLVLVGLSRRLRQTGYWNENRPEPDLVGLLDLVSLGTVADVVPLRGLNRAYVTRGLAVMRQRRRTGLRTLMDVARLDGPPSVYHLGFLLGPRINAGGRIGDAALGARLLLTDDDAQAAEISVTLDRLNRERQTIEAGMLEEALAEADAALGRADGAPVIITASDRWHPGVAGLVAARLKERYGRPAFAIAFGEAGQGTGSGRSIAGVDLGKAVREAVEAGVIVKGGGHAMAAGVTLEQGRLGAFRSFMEEHLQDAVARARAAAGLDIDGAISAAGATPAFLQELERVGPFGQGNPEPVFAIPGHVISFADAVGGAHLKVRLKAPTGQTLDAIAFRALGQPLGEELMSRRGQKVHVAGSLSLDRWGGRERVQLRILDAAAPE